MSGSNFTTLDRQREIYLNGFAGIRSAVPIDWHKLEDQARKSMSPEAYAYIAGGAGLEDTVAANRVSFDRYKIIPRMLRDVSRRSAQT
ncbi:MAG TPA: alpha-hydroxy-acid oxidizing protein, partial [Cyclobacteriaceae bacterium]|nr:alpha-hydroxy-acid oxidizing protein [Cyclobacteriaceae bacterium]